MKQIFCNGLLLLALLIPALLAGQGYPQVYNLTGLERFASGGEFGGPDWWSHESYSYICDQFNPMQIIEIDLHYQGWTYDFPPSDYYQSWDFDGEVTLYPDHYTITNPLTLVSNIDPVRTRKMDYQGYCHEDDWYSYNNKHFHAWHSYNADMKLIHTVIKALDANQNEQWWDSIYTLDDLGRRMEEMTQISADSLSWTNYRRRQYLYSGEQFPPGYQFEKHSLLLPEYILRNFTFCFPYMNDNWIISSLIEQDANPQGVWYDPMTQTYNTQVQEITGTVTLNGDANIFNAEGLLQQIGGDGLGYDFYYAHSSEIASEDETVPATQKLQVWPNPVRHEATLGLPAKASGSFSLNTYNLKGQLVKTEMQVVDTANPVLTWTALEDSGKPLSSGIYLIRAQGKDFADTARVMVLN